MMTGIVLCRNEEENLYPKKQRRERDSECQRVLVDDEEKLARAQAAQLLPLSSF